MPKLDANAVALIVLGAIGITGLALLGKDGLILAASIASGIAGWMSRSASMPPDAGMIK